MLKPGKFISDRYEIIERVGSGGMADVYKAKCHRLNRFVAIKVLKPEYSNDKNFVTKFRAEAQSAAGLSHPNIVNVYDVGDDDGLYYIVMELVEGITLKRFIERRGRLEVKEAVGIAIQIAQGMEAAHANHIIHRDIKPQNIIISRDGKVKVTDFGIAKAATSNTVTQNAIGSVHYLSPEQARGGYSDEKSDIYSLGVTLYEMLSGQVPFAGDNTVSVALLHIQSEAIPVIELNSSVPMSVNKIVIKCMQKKPERRYLSATELIRDLKRSVLQPDGDYIDMDNSDVNSSPTIMISDDEFRTIKHAVKKENEQVHQLSAASNETDKPRKVPQKVDKEDVEELDGIDSKVEKILTIATVIVAIIVGLAALILTMKLFGLFDLFNSKEGVTPTPISAISSTPSVTGSDISPTGASLIVKVPSVIGLNVDDAIKTLEARSKKFEINYSKEDYSAEYAAGQVMAQYPVGETDVLEDSVITLTISVGPEPIKVPFVDGLTSERAADTITSQGLLVENKYEISDEFEENKVIRTEPAANETVFVGDKIILVISLGPDQSLVEVPSVLGFDEIAAEAALMEKGLKKGIVTPGYSNTYPAGQISFQSTTSGQMIARGTSIDLTISLGPEPTPTPLPTPSPKPTPTPAPVYRGQVTITDDGNPFNPNEKGEIILEVVQNEGLENEMSKYILEKDLTYDDLAAHPTYPVEAFIEGPAKIRVYVNGTLFWTYDINIVETYQ